MLDLFRVRNFTAVSFDADRLEKLRDLEKDRALLIFDRQEVLQEPGPRVTVQTVQEAVTHAGYPLRAPQELPRSLVLENVQIEGRGAARLSADADQIQEILNALNLNDVQVPRELDGQWVTIRKPPVVFQEYRSQRNFAALAQAPSPEVELPPGADLARLAELGMRILGVDRAQARQLSQSVDWRTTLLVPVPHNAASFRSVHVNGNPGLLIATSSRSELEGPRSGDRVENIVMWSDNGHLFALIGNLDSVDTMRVAESVR
jgi:hypothetical protein